MKFLVDGMLGKLAKALRILGLDTVYTTGTDILTLLSHARNQGRVLLTLNHKLKGRADVFFITSEKVEEQLKDLFKHFSLENKIRPFSRCLVCNNELRKVTKEEVRNLVPFFTYRTQNEFSRCPGCGRIYWPGSHLRDMAQRLKPLLKVSRGTPNQL